MMKTCLVLCTQNWVNIVFFSMKYLGLSLVCFVLIVSTGCSFKDPITFTRIEGVKLAGINSTYLNVKAEAVFNNPNTVRGKLKRVELMVLIKQDTVAKLSQAESLKIQKDSEFRVPLNIKLAMKDLQKGLLSNAISMLTRKKLNLRFVGEIKVSTSGFSRRVPVDYTVDVKL